jgi:hypothetical protein
VIKKERELKMKNKWVLIIVVLVVISLIPETAYAQELNPTSDLDITALASGFADPEFRVIILATLIAGAAGGVVYELLTLQGNIEKPHQTEENENKNPLVSAIAKYCFDLGIWARVIIGAFAALSVLFVFSPPTTMALISMAVIAGSAGSAVFGALQDRLKALLAMESELDLRINSGKAEDKVYEASALLADVKKMRLNIQGQPNLALLTPEDLGLDEFDSIERLLNEAKGIYEAIRK